MQQEYTLVLILDGSKALFGGALKLILTLLVVECPLVDSQRTQG